MNGTCGTRPLNWPDLPDSQAAGGKQSTTLLSVYVFLLQASAKAVYGHSVCQHLHSIWWQLYRMVLTCQPSSLGLFVGLFLETFPYLILSGGREQKWDWRWSSWTGCFPLRLICLPFKASSRAKYFLMKRRFLPTTPCNEPLICRVTWLFDKRTVLSESQKLSNLIKERWETAVPIMAYCGDKVLSTSHYDAERWGCCCCCCFKWK